MPRTKNFSIGLKDKSKKSSKKSILFLIIFLILAINVNVFLAQTATEQSDIGNHSIDTALKMLQNDMLALYIRPNVENLSVESESKSLWVTIVVSKQGSSIIYMRPRSAGMYKLTVTFQVNSTWGYRLGIYTNNINWFGYGPRGNITMGTYGYFIEVSNQNFSSPGNYAINILVDSYEKETSGFSLRLPESVNAVFFVTLVGFIIYFNIFFIFDTYFKNKREGVTRNRWLLCGLLIIVSVYIIYELYRLLTFQGV